MKLQLTKTKTINVALPGFASGKSSVRDVTGIDAVEVPGKGCPAVRLVRRRNSWHLAAFGFVPPPPATLPESWDDLNGRTETWVLPAAFHAPMAAVAAEVPTQTARQTTTETILSEAKHLLNGKTDALPRLVPGEPLSFNGQRMIVHALAEDNFVLQAALPEFQALWFTRLMPEGHRPTIQSVQLRPFAQLAAIAVHPDFMRAGGNAFCVIVESDCVYLAGWKNGELALFRECPHACGWVKIRQAVKTDLGIDEEVVDEILDSNLIDPSNVIEPFLRPILHEIEFSIAYMAHRLGVKLDRVLLLGLPAGGIYWNKIAEEKMHTPMATPNLFASMTASSRFKRELAAVTSSQSQLFLGALGAARAAMEI